MKILITGARGFIGASLSERLAIESKDLICQSRDFHKSLPGIEWIKHDFLSDSWDLLSLKKIDIVYHLAGQTSVYAAKNNPLADLNANSVGFVRLLEVLRRLPERPFVVLAGTATQVGLTSMPIIKEELPDKPITFYDISKQVAEMYLMQYIREGWLDGCALRFANVYGRYKDDQRIDRGIIDKIFRLAVSGETIKIYGNGLYLRDYVFIDDVVSALVLAAIKRKSTNGRSFYIGTGKGTTLKDAFVKVINLANNLTGVNVGYEHVSPPIEMSDIEFRNAIIDSNEFIVATGWSPKYDFETGMSVAYSKYNS